MYSTLITLLTLAFIVAPVISRFRRTMASSAEASSEAPRSPYTAYEQEEEEEAYVRPEPEPYFTYESEAFAAEPEPSKKTSPRVASIKAEQPMAMPAEGQGVQGFDLRQAVIYQTLLNNDYIGEINYSKQYS